MIQNAQQQFRQAAADFALNQKGRVEQANLRQRHTFFKLLERVGDGLDGALRVGLDDDLEHLGALERRPREIPCETALLEAGLAEQVLALGDRVRALGGRGVTLKVVPAMAVAAEISPASTFCHMRPVTLSVMVPSPLSVNDCGFALGAAV